MARLEGVFIFVSVLFCLFGRDDTTLQKFRRHLFIDLSGDWNQELDDDATYPSIFLLPT